MHTAWKITWAAFPLPETGKLLMLKG